MNFNNSTPQVDNTDWLKTIAIILVVIDHFGYFFIEDAEWWSVVGRLAAPPFFFLMGYAQTRAVPLRWLGLGVLLTLLDSWNNDWAWVAPNILLSFALIRLARPYVKTLLQQHGWRFFFILTALLIAVLPASMEMVDYGAEGWLWAFFGLMQRMYVDFKPAGKVECPALDTVPASHMNTMSPGLMRSLSCIVAAVVYIWQEQSDFLFSGLQFGAVIFGVCILSAGLYLFQRGPSRIQPPQPMAGTLHFIGRHTLEIYALQLAGSEIIIGLIPQLAA